MKSGVLFTEFAPFTPNDGIAKAAAILIHHEVWRDSNPADKDIDSVLLRHVIVAHDSVGNVMSAGALAAFDTGEHVITELATAKPHQGEGLGREVVKLLEKKAKKLGAKQTKLYALVGSKSFFAEIGYVEEKEGEMVKRL